jgi:vanillate O-demethylase monooxygenase subunit
MHPEVVPPDIEMLPPLEEVEVSERSVSYFRELPSSRLAPWEAEITGLPTDTAGIRREEGTFVSPALHVQHYVIAPEAGKGDELLRIQGFTPESPGATHVFLQMARNFATDNDGVGEFLRTMFHDWADRDADVLEAIQHRLEEDTVPRRDINVKADRAAVRARRIVMDMVDDESGRFVLNGALP